MRLIVSYLAYVVMADERARREIGMGWEEGERVMEDDE